MTETLVPSPAAEMLAAAFALDLAELGEPGVPLLIEQGKGLAQGDLLTIPAGEPTRWWLLASAAFARAWARHDPVAAPDLLRSAQDLETVATFALVDPRTDA